MKRIPRKLKKKLKKRFKIRYGYSWLYCENTISMYKWLFKNPLNYNTENFIGIL